METSFLRTIGNSADGSERDGEHDDRSGTIYLAVSVLVLENRAAADAYFGRRCKCSVIIVLFVRCFLGV